MYIFMYKKTSILFYLVSIHPERCVIFEVIFKLSTVFIVNLTIKRQTLFP